MPRDDWAKASRKDAAKRGVKNSLPVSGKKKRRRRRDRKDKKVLAETIARKRLSSENTILWFGKHKGMRVGDIPRGYLWWLVQNHDQGRSWQMDMLCTFLQDYLREVPWVSAANTGPADATDRAMSPRGEIERGPVSCVCNRKFPGQAVNV
jgi:uncharacterized protein (DUF3820 family)